MDCRRWRLHGAFGARHDAAAARRPSEGLLGGGPVGGSCSSAFSSACSGCVAGYGFWRAGNAKWQTVLFTSSRSLRFPWRLAARSERESLFRQGLFTNKSLLAACSLTLLLQLAAVYLPAGQSLLHTLPLSGPELAVCLAAKYGRLRRSRNREMVRPQDSRAKEHSWRPVGLITQLREIALQEIHSLEESTGCELFGLVQSCTAYG